MDVGGGGGGGGEGNSTICNMLSFVNQSSS